MEKLIPITFHTSTIQKLIPEAMEDFIPYNNDTLIAIDLPPWIIKDWCKCEKRNYKTFIKAHTAADTEKLAHYIALALAIERQTLEE